MAFEVEDNGSGGCRIAKRRWDGRIIAIAGSEFSHAHNAQIAADRLNGIAERGTDWARFYRVREAA